MENAKVKLQKNKKARYRIWLFLWLTAWAGVGGLATDHWQLTTWGCVLEQAQGLSLRVWRAGGGLGTHGRMGGVVRHAYIETPKSPRVN